MADLKLEEVDHNDQRSNRYGEEKNRIWRGWGWVDLVYMVWQVSLAVKAWIGGTNEYSTSED